MTQINNISIQYSGDDILIIVSYDEHNISKVRSTTINNGAHAFELIGKLQIFVNNLIK